MSDSPAGNGDPAASCGVSKEFTEKVYLSTLEHLQASYLANEEMGERRLQIYLTVLSAAALAVGLVSEVQPAEAADGHVPVLWAAAVAAFLVFVLGLASIVRMARRDLTTTEMLGALAEARRTATMANSAFPAKMPWTDPPGPRRWAFLKGGLTVTLVLLNSMVAGLAAVSGIVALDVHTGWVALGLVVFLLAFVHQWLLVTHIYRRKLGS